jgi:disease resistance protein RPM1
MTLEEVAEGYLTELIHRNLVQVVSINVDGRAKGCRVHDILHAMILKKFDDLCFCKSISDDGQSTLTGIVRRQSIPTNSDNLMESIESSQVRSLLIFKPYPLHESFLRQLPTKCRLLKVLDVEPAGEIIEVPEELGSLIHLKYFSIVKATRERILLPKSIGMLENLETLDLAGTLVIDFPKEICKLRKLRHFLGDSMSLIQLKDGIGGMTSLQTLRGVYLDENEDENDNKVVELIEELGKLNQLKELGLLGVKRKYMSVISSSINKMQQLEKLYIKSTPQSGVIDLHLNVPKLRYLVLHGELEKLPEWIPELQYLVKLKLIYSKLTDDDIMESLKSMPNLLSISLREDAYVGETLHFQNEWFMNLKELYLVGLKNLKSILIGQGALPSLKKLHIFSTPQLKALPTGIQHLKKLEDLDMRDMGYDFMTNFYSAGGSIHWVFRLAPYVHIHTTPGPTWVGGCVSRPDRREDDFKSFSRFFS